MKDHTIVCAHRQSVHNLTGRIKVRFANSVKVNSLQNSGAGLLALRSSIKHALPALILFALPNSTGIAFTIHGMLLLTLYSIFCRCK